MSEQSSLAPKERVNIKFTPATGEQGAEVELPFKTLVLGDFSGGASEVALEDRVPVGIAKDNFDEVFREMGLALALEVRSTLDESDPEASLSAVLEFRSFKDFGPDAVARQIPELSKLVELRDALTALKGPLGNIPAFRNAVTEILEDPEQRAVLLSHFEGGG